MSSSKTDSDARRGPWFNVLENNLSHEMQINRGGSTLPNWCRLAGKMRVVLFSLVCLYAFPTTAQVQSRGLNTIYSQIINFSPDSTVGKVDFYADDTRLIDGMDRYSAAPFFTLITGDAHTIAVTPDSSIDASEALLSTTLPVTDGASLVAALVGVSDPELNHNPDGVDVSLALAIRDDARRENLEVGTLLVSVLHAAPRAKSLWVSAGPELTLVADSLRFGEFSDYVQVPFDSTETYFYFYESEFGPIGSCGGDIISLYNGCLQIPSDDLLQIGNVFTLVIQEMDPNGISLLAASAVFPNGIVVPIRYHVSLGLNEAAGNATSDVFDLPIFPLPSSDYVTVLVEVASPANATLDVVDLSGRLVRKEKLGVVSNGVHPIGIDVRGLADGVYFCRLRLVGPTRTDVRLGRFVVAR